MFGVFSVFLLWWVVIMRCTLQDIPSDIHFAFVSQNHETYICFEIARSANFASVSWAFVNVRYWNNFPYFFLFQQTVITRHLDTDGLVQNYSKSIANATELLKSRTKQSICLSIIFVAVSPHCFLCSRKYFCIISASYKKDKMYALNCFQICFARWTPQTIIYISFCGKSKLPLQ